MAVTVMTVALVAVTVVLLPSIVMTHVMTDFFQFRFLDFLLKEKRLLDQVISHTP